MTTFKPFDSEIKRQHDQAFLAKKVNSKKAKSIMKDDQCWIDGEKFLIKNGKRNFYCFMFKKQTNKDQNILTVVTFDVFGKKHFSIQPTNKHTNIDFVIQNLLKNVLLHEENMFLSGQPFKKFKFPKSWHSQENTGEFLEWFRKEFGDGSLETCQTNKSKFSVYV